MNLREAIAANNDAIDGVLVNAMPDLEAALRVAERELSIFVRALPREADSWTAHKQRSVLMQLKSLSEHNKERAGAAIRRDLHRGLGTAGTASLRSLRRIVAAGEKQFGVVQPLRLDIAGVIASSERTLLHRMGSFASRYGERVGQRMRRDLMIGILHGETLDQMSARLLRGTGEIRKLREQGPVQLADAAAEHVTRINRSDGDRIVRTELVNAYNEVGLEGVRVADREDPGFEKRWDAAADSRTCPGCRELDNVIVGLHEMFVSAFFGVSVEHSPLHSFCRCAVVPWRRGWSL